MSSHLLWLPKYTANNRCDVGLRVRAVPACIVGFEVCIYCVDCTSCDISCVILLTFKCPHCIQRIFHRSNVKKNFNVP
jgi:hypothetical protein